MSEMTMNRYRCSNLCRRCSCEDCHQIDDFDFERTVVRALNRIAENTEDIAECLCKTEEDECGCGNIIYNSGCLSDYNNGCLSDYNNGCSNSYNNGCSNSYNNGCSNSYNNGCSNSYNNGCSNSCNNCCSNCCNNCCW